MNPINRRNVLKGAAGVTAAGIGAAAFAGGAAAQTDANFTANKITGDTADGVVTSLLVRVTGSFAFEGLDSAATGATVTLAARDTTEDAEFEDLASTTVTPPAAQQADDVDFGTLEGDLLSLEQFSGAQFSADEDGATNESDIELQLTTTVEYGTDNSVTDTPTTTLDVAMTNTPAAATATGDAGGEMGTSHHIGTSPDGVLDVRAIYGADAITFTVELGGGGWPASESAANFNLNFDVDDTAAAEEFQVGWHASGESDLPAGGFVKVNDGSSRTAYHADDAGGVTVDELTEFTEYRVTVPRDMVPSSYLEGSYRFAAYASDGGEGDVYVITTDDAAPDWSNASNFLEVPIPDEE